MLLLCILPCKHAIMCTGKWLGSEMEYFISHCVLFMTKWEIYFNHSHSIYLLPPCFWHHCPVDNSERLIAMKCSLSQILFWNYPWHEERIIQHKETIHDYISSTVFFMNRHRILFHSYISYHIISYQIIYHIISYYINGLGYKWMVWYRTTANNIAIMNLKH